MSKKILTDPIISYETRDLMLSVWDQENATLPYLHRMQNVVRLNEVLGYLVRQRITGKKFIDWLQQEHGGNLVDAICFVLKKVNRDVVSRGLIHGRDWK